MTKSKQEHEVFHEAARASLAHWAWPEDSELSLLKYRENAVFKAVTPDGRKAAIRVHRPNYHSACELTSELQWMHALHSSGIPVSQAVPTQTNELLISVTPAGSSELFWVDMLAWIDGAPIGSAESRDYADALSVEPVYREIGRLAALMHEQSSTWSTPANFFRPAWDTAGCVGISEQVVDNIGEPLWGDFKDLDVLSQEQRAVLSRAAEIASAAMNAFGTSSDRYGLVHADLVPDNLMETEAGLIVIDFDDCGYGWYLWDLVTAVFWHLGEQTYDDALRGYIDGYRSVRELPDSHLALIPSMLVLRALVYLGWMHSRRGTDTARELTAHVIATSEQLSRQLLDAADLSSSAASPSLTN
ncbi:serine/threonine protein kinase [Caballeronia hypogeia]|uniref:Serine/threonine protein kinase n=1 Tax=Caballeronia hypogeia TaxID=1777140 RepID=A0A158CKF9_9BURK|nr:phosphotransferase [Caballeronia hypogeia]SAK82356.1 serine/threonine protein kinase [Caballeronia hypogeia]